MVLSLKLREGNKISRIFLSKKGEGILTGVLWMAAVAITSGLIAYAMWGSNGIGGAASVSKATPGTTITTLKTNVNALTP